MTKSKKTRIEPTPFGQTAGRDVYNASEIVAVDDSRFLFCDNNLGGTLVELSLAPDGSMAAPLVPRPLAGLPEGAVDDLEGLAIARTNDETFLFASPSLSLKQRKNLDRKPSKRGKEAPGRNGLVRMRLGADARLEAEVIPDFRSWLVAGVPALAEAAQLLPDDGGLNVEALGWNSTSGALLVCVRTPVSERGPLVVPVRVRDLAGAWSLETLELLPPIVLQIEDAGDEQGIRAIDHDPAGGGALVVVGNSTSRSKAPFHLYAWDGNEAGEVRRFSGVRFAKQMKPEGVTRGTIAGRDAVVFVDDAGGYAVVWADDPRLAG
jgi:hypothetical protein